MNQPPTPLAMTPLMSSPIPISSDVLSQVKLENIQALPELYFADALQSGNASPELRCGEGRLYPDPFVAGGASSTDGLVDFLHNAVTSNVDVSVPSNKTDGKKRLASSTTDPTASVPVQNSKRWKASPYASSAETSGGQVVISNVSLKKELDEMGDTVTYFKDPACASESTDHLLWIQPKNCPKVPPVCVNVSSKYPEEPPRVDLKLSAYDKSPHLRQVKEHFIHLVKGLPQRHAVSTIVQILMTAAQEGMNEGESDWGSKSVDVSPNPAPLQAQ